MYLDLSHYAGGMQTYSKHISSFQAFVNMKLNPSRVLRCSSLCKNEPMPILHLVITFLSSNFYQMRLGCFIPSPPSLWPIICFHLVVITFLRDCNDEWFFQQPLDHYMFLVVPPLLELVSTLYTTRSSRRSPLLSLFRLLKYENIVEHLSFQTRKSK